MSHPNGTRARVLLTSVFGPFAQDDRYGSRAINPIELYHNQVTRAQGPFSIRMFHRSWGIMLIQRNINAACTVLDFPTRDRFVREITRHSYDVIGISAIVVNVAKVAEMCRLIRRHAPRAVIVVGGHVTAIPDIARRVDADHIVRGEGVRWMREYLGEDPDRPIEHPPIRSSFGFQLMGLRMPTGGGNPAATILSSVGCPLGCNFCTTSAFFGGKGRVVRFFDRGADLFKVMCDSEARLGVRCFFVMDENFLLYKKRTMELLDCMRAHGKRWSMYVFSSANAIAKYDPRELVELGITWIWLGLESAASSYGKLRGADTQSLTRELQSHGIRVHGSTIIGLEHHTPENLAAEIDHAVAHGTDCHQFMLYTPVPGTPLYAQLARSGHLLDVDFADIHGQYKFNFVHPAISRDDSKLWLDHAFHADYRRNGPSVFRLCRTMLAGWRRYRGDADGRVRARVEAEARELVSYTPVLWAMEKYLRRENLDVAWQVRALRLELEREFGARARALAAFGGPLLLWSTRREARRFPSGRPLEPRTFVDRGVAPRARAV